MKPRTAVFLLVLAPLVLAQDPVGKPAPGVAAEKGTIRKTIKSKGTFASVDPDELKLELKSYRGELKLLEIRENGSMVRAGDIIARIETKGIDRQLVSEKLGLEKAEIDWTYAQASARLKEASDKAKKEDADRSLRRAELKLDGFLKHEKAHTKESERLSLEGRKHRIENQLDELTQLEKMYSEDELVDATEEIVLKRSRRGFARSKASFELSERRRLYRKEFYEAWREEDMRLGVERQKRSHESSMLSLEASRKKASIDLAKKKIGIDKTRESYADLEKDRAQFVIRASRDGRLIHSGATLKKDGTLRNKSVFARIGDPQRLKVKTAVTEKDILAVKNGMACEIDPTCTDDFKLMGRLKVETLPSKGSFSAEVSLTSSNRKLLPGMTCSVIMVVAEARDVVTVPAWAVTERDGKKFVKLSTGSREVKVGISDGKKTAILEGLEVGEKVLK